MNDASIDFLFSRYRNRGILIDTNILLLYFVGTANRERISRFNRTEQFTPEDYDLLVKIIQYFQKLVTTPNIMTEVSNLMDKIGEPDRSKCFGFLNNLAPRLDEFYTETKAITAVPEFKRFGLTDCGILGLAKDSYLVLTDDLKLFVTLQTQSIDAINFNNIRVSGWRNK
jgi:hypothetical protein